MDRNDTQDIPDLEDGEGLSVHDAASRIEGLLSDDDLGIGESSSTAKPRKPAPRDSDPDDEEDLEDEEEGEEREDDEDVDDEDEDPEVDKDDEDEEEAEEAAAPAKGRKYTVKVDGDEDQVTLDELLAGYSRTSSFTKKSQKLAEERRQHDAEVAARHAEIQAAQEHYVTQLTALESALASQEPDWEAVRRDNPEQFAELHAAWAIHQKRLDRIRAERESEQAKLATASQEQLKQIVKSERAKLVEKIPEWGDSSDKGKAFRRAIREYGESAGFTPKELESVADHRALVLLHKAFLYDQSQKQRSEKIAKGKKKVESLPSMRPGTKTGKRSTQSSKAAQARARLKKTGNVRDAAAAIEMLLD